MAYEVLLYEQFRDLSLSFPKLSLQKNNEGPWIIKGLLALLAEYSGHLIDDEYAIEIIIPEEYPDRLPRLRETGNRIPRSFHHYQDGSLCLGAPLAIKKKFSEEPTLVGFVNNCCIPYLYSYSYKSKNGKMPFGELSHGGQGILEYYQDLFDLKSNRALLGLIKILVDDNYRGHIKCPCGSGKRLRSCHGSTLLEIKELQPASDFRNEYIYILKTLVENQ